MRTTAHLRSAPAVSPVLPVASSFAQPMAQAFLSKHSRLQGKEIAQVGAIAWDLHHVNLVMQSW